MNNEEDITKVPLPALITEITFLEQDIDMKIMKYEKLKKELIRRFPVIEQEDVFKTKTLVKEVRSNE